MNKMEGSNLGGHPYQGCRVETDREEVSLSGMDEVLSHDLLGQVKR